MTHCRPFAKVLVANRGEIARRVLRAHPVTEAGMGGSVSSVLVSTGQRIASGEGIAVVEAMKTLHHVASNVGGTVTEVRVAPGDQVAQGQLLAMVCRDAEQEQP